MSNSNQQRCYLCNSDELTVRHGQVRDNPDIMVLECSSCSLVFLSSFSHISEDFYKNKFSGMHEGDIDSFLRKIEKDDERRYQWVKPVIANRTLLDFGCGTGGFLLKAAKSARKVVGVETDQRNISHFKENGLSVFESLDVLEARGEVFDVITMFHVLEHLTDPVGMLQRLSKILASGGQLLIEVPSADDALLTLYNSQAFADFTYWSSHLFTFNTATLTKIVIKAGLKVNYIKQVQRHSLANHLRWLSEGKPGGHKDWHFIDSDELGSAYEKQLASIGRCDTLYGKCSN
jgi:2-polyprenyl-3-methyl-5-hydroxy-6-metoxy-1,4-benzoquinol methylase